MKHTNILDSDESDYEDQSFKSFHDQDESFKSCNDKDNEGVGEKKAYLSFFSDHSDSDGNDEYYNKNIDKVKFKPHKMYEVLSCKQNSGDEGSSQSIQNVCIDNSPNCNNKVETGTKRKRHADTLYNKKQKIHKPNKDVISTDKDVINKERDFDTKNKPETKSILSGNNKGKRMLEKMGFIDGFGLGKNKQGRLEPVQVSKQRGRRGLGLYVPGLEASSLKWNPAEEEIKVEEDMEWIKCPNFTPPTLKEMQLWLQKGPKKLTLDDETHFCSKDIVKKVINAKTVFDNLDAVEICRARTRCNPYETIRGAFFLNRAAVKMANIDRACNFMFTNPENLEKNELLYFADVCAGPGGFSEYVLWRKKWHAKGFGLTLKGENDFKLSEFHAAPCETFHPYYGPQNTGDVYDPANQDAFKNLIMTHTHGKGVHFMMSDGGFSVKGQENIQEILSKQLYLCQCLIALMIVKVKGHFVTKLFDVFTPFSAGLVYLMYRCFDEICIFKPNSSRPANSERYLICKGKRTGIKSIVQHLKCINHHLLKGDDNNDILQLVSFEELEREKQFVQYLRNSNDYLGKKQIIGLCKIAAFCEDSTLVETKQADMRRECLEYWKLPDESRINPSVPKPRDKFNSLVKDSTLLSSNGIKLTMDNIETMLSNPYDYFYMPCSTGRDNKEERHATFYMGMGRGNVYRYLRNSWVSVDDIKIELPPDTLVYAEVVCEMLKEFKQQRNVLALHIIDAFILGAEDINQKYLRER